MSDPSKDRSDKPPVLPHDLPIVVAQLTRYGEQISKEFTLVNDRMTWMVVAEAFIFGAFATAAGDYDQAKNMKVVIGALLILMPILGILLALSVIPAIAAAHEAVEYLKIGREEYEKQLVPEGLQIKAITVGHEWHKEGNAPAQIVPFIIIVFWVALLCATGWVFSTSLDPISK